MSKAENSKFIYTALKEAQDNIRTYDTKAQIVGIGFIFTINILFNIAEFNKVESEIFQWPLNIISWWIILFPVVLFGSVLYPTRKVAPKVLKNKEVVKGLFYMNLFEVEDVNDYVSNLQDMDITQELSYELLKVSYLRDLKRKRFLLAMSAASISLILLFVLQFVL